jgi:hypothetical protein
MVATRNSPSVLRIIWVDYWAYLGTALILGPWLILVIFFFLDMPLSAFTEIMMEECQ